MIPLLTESFDLSLWYHRKVAKDYHITLENNYYSVPAKYILTEVTVQLSSKLVQVYITENELIARHAIAEEKGIFTTNPGLIIVNINAYVRALRNIMNIINSKCIR